MNGSDVGWAVGMAECADVPDGAELVTDGLRWRAREGARSQARPGGVAVDESRGGTEGTGQGNAEVGQANLAMVVRRVVSWTGG